MADLTGLVGKRRMRERLHQFRAVGLVRIVAADTVGCSERLVLVCLLQIGIFRVVTVKAQCRRGFGQMKAILGSIFCTRLVRDVASVAPHIEGGMPAALLRDIHSFAMAGEAQIVVLAGARGGLQQLVLVVRTVRVVTCEAIAHGGLMNVPFNLRGILISMATQAQLRRRSGDQLYPGRVLIHSYFMATQAAGLHGRMDGLTLRLIAVALQTLGGFNILVEGDGVDIREHHARRGSEGEKNQKGSQSEAKSLPIERGIRLATGS